MSFTLTINGTAHSLDNDQATVKLLDYLHDTRNLTGTKLCCGIGVCRACTVSVQKGPGSFAEPVIACSTPLATLNGARITTIEGVAVNGDLSKIQQAFLDNFSFQCGYCTPGFVMAAEVFLGWLAVAEVDKADLDALIKNAIGDHICRCTGYVRYAQALHKVALEMLEAKQ